MTASNFPLLTSLLWSVVIVAAGAAAAAASVLNAQKTSIINRSLILNDQLEVSWTVDFDKNSIAFDLIGATHGFIGFGLSSQGGMSQADLIIGGVLENGEPYFSDRFATGKFEPKVDDHADWFLDEATEDATHTRLKFHRFLETCDLEDLSIDNDTTKFIWSMGATDIIEYHGDRRGVTAVNILDDSDTVVDTSHFQTWNITVNTMMPAVDTTYWCTVHKTPAEYTKTRHIVGYKVLLESDLAIKHNHHLVLHKCLAPPGSDVANVLEGLVGTPGRECYNEMDDGSFADIMMLCSSYLYVWAKGGGPLFLPDNIGLPLAEDGLVEYCMLEIHYDNPESTSGIQYETGLQVYSTTELREHTAGVLTVGQGTGMGMMIPPHADSFLVTGHCSSGCTASQFPPDGINVFNVLLHSHLSGRKLKLRQFRPDPAASASADDDEGTEILYQELPWVSYDNNYDFNYQQNRPLREYIKVMPGDHLTYECDYNTSWKNPPGAVLGGESTRNEMCQTFLLYYPRQNLDLCMSQQVGFDVFYRLGIEEFDPTSAPDNPIIAKPAKWAGMNYSTFLDTEVDWTPELIMEVQEMGMFNRHLDACFSYANFSNENSFKLEKSFWQSLTIEETVTDFCTELYEPYNMTCVTYPANHTVYVPKEPECPPPDEPDPNLPSGAMTIGHQATLTFIILFLELTVYAWM